MDKEQFTPGPWKMERNKIWKYNDGSTAFILAECGNGYTKYNTVEANANLIAAAPDMYEALKELVTLKALKDNFGKDAEYEARQPKAWEAAKNALSKANTK